MTKGIKWFACMIFLLICGWILSTAVYATAEPDTPCFAVDADQLPSGVKALTVGQLADGCVLIIPSTDKGYMPEITVVNGSRTDCNLAPKSIFVRTYETDQNTLELIIDGKTLVLDLAVLQADDNACEHKYERKKTFDIPATCTSIGFAYRQCGKCGTVQLDMLPPDKDNHLYSPWRNTAYGNLVRVCRENDSHREMQSVQTPEPTPAPDDDEDLDGAMKPIRTLEPDDEGLDGAMRPIRTLEPDDEGLDGAMRPIRTLEPDDEGFDGAMRPIRTLEPDDEGLDGAMRPIRTLDPDIG